MIFEKFVQSQVLILDNIFLQYSNQGKNMIAFVDMDEYNYENLLNMY